METPTLTQEQINTLLNNESLIFGKYIIVYHPDSEFEIYTQDQAEDSDPNPIFTGTAQEIITYFENL